MSEYEIKTVTGKTGYVAANHRHQELLVSEDIKVNRTDDGKICATFSNSREQEPTFSDFVNDLFRKPKYQDNSDCSIIISDPTKFHYCTQKDGEYQLFGGDVTFKGTPHDDKLTMYECENTTIDLGDGDDIVKIAGAKKGGFLADFKNNIIKTGNDNDTVTISGSFNQFKDNKIFLGKGNDKFEAEINPEDDVNVTNASTYDKMEHVYMKNVSGSEVHASDGDKGWFEKDSFKSKTYSANKLKLSDFNDKEITFKLQPAKTTIIEPKKETIKSEENSTVTFQENKSQKSNKKLTDRDYLKIYQLNSLQSMMFDDGKAQERALKAAADMVNSWE